VINQDPPPPDDRGYERYLAGLAKECQCCVACVNPPCPGLEAGGFCDGYCGCPDGDEGEDDFGEEPS
jgi:hypothetical protein